MSTVRIDQDRWERLEKKEVEFTLKRKKLTKKSEIINILLDRVLDKVKMNADGEIYIEQEDGKPPIKV
ncbi:hypothetical protein [Pseudomonas sp. ANT_H12B]|uniref:hypothetical protein n=1 Tax=Pseudomonas sp. ANT_H12B TaxID=2597348 RepID=UPI0011ECE9F6|nr:hypothetical protein [Pseudomonas sp. ANT_H12B]KAA0980022.1 hypothetical protein FQ185_00010 [Pseudomonas sp. ANT_H12B]